MNTFKLNLLVLAFGLSLAGGAIAQTLSKDDYKAAKQKISADYKAAKAGCDSLASNAQHAHIEDPLQRAHGQGPGGLWGVEGAL